jgi:hypothetical protein
MRDRPGRGRRGRRIGGPRHHVGGELLVAEDREAFLQRELEPVAAGDPVARPVVEVFVGDDALDVFKIQVGAGVGVGQHVLGVEDVEALVLHRAHVEIRHGDDHEAVEVQLEAEDLLVPAQGMHQRIHRVGNAVEIARLDPHLQQHLAARHRVDLALQRLQIRRHQREQVGRLEERVFPAGKVAAVRQAAGFEQVAVGEQHRAGGGVRLEAHGEARHHVGRSGK